MPKKILVALDNSSYADKVANYALDVAAKEGGILFGLGVIEADYLNECSADDQFACMTRDFWRTSFKTTLNKCHKLAEERQQYFKIYEAEGNAAEEILKFAEKEYIDLIILGHLGKGAAAGGGFPIGSVAQKVAAFSKCPVLIVK